jgi:hypothetical protein
MDPQSPKSGYIENLHFKQLLAQICDSLNTLENENKATIEYIRVFLACSFRYIKEKPANENLLKRLIRNNEKRAILRFLRIWILEYFTRDFQKQRTLKELLKFIEDLNKKRPHLCLEINKVKLALIRKSYESKCNNVNISFSFSQGVNSFNSTAAKKRLFSFTPKEIAEHLTLLDSRYLSTLSLRDFLIKDKATVLAKIEERVSKMGYWVASNILAQKTVSNQVKVIQYFLFIGQFCEKLGNYHSLNAIMIGLYMNCIQRLTKFWSSKFNRTIQIILGNLTALVESKANYSYYREVLAKRKSKLQEKEIIIPNIMIFKRDFSMTDEGNPDYIDGKINREKLNIMIKLLTEISNYQNIANTYSIGEPNSIVLSHLQKFNHWTDDKLDKRSEEIRPRENSSTDSSTSVADGSEESIVVSDDIYNSDLIDVSTDEM